MSEASEMLAARFANGPVFCEYCGRRVHQGDRGDRGARATIDLRVPRMRGGRNRGANRALCCARCNQQKGPLTEEEFRAARSDGIDTRRLHALLHNASDGRPIYASRSDRKRARKARRAAQLAAREVGSS